MERIEGRTALVTGAGSGIGLGIARALVNAGASVVMADWNRESVELASAGLGPSTRAFAFDVRDRTAWEAAREFTQSSFGPVEILVNNAGVGPDFSEMVDVPVEHFERLMGILVTGVFNGVQTFGPGMRERRDGHIVNTSSLCGLYAAARMGAYAIAKYGVVGLSEVLELEMSAYGVGVSVLCPGSVRTNLEHGQQPAAVRASIKSAAPDRPIDPDVVGAIVVDAIRANDLYIITHAEFAPSVARRDGRVLDAFARTAQRDAEAAAPTQA